MQKLSSVHARRGHVADFVLEDLVRRILLGETAPGTPLEPERVLSKQYGVSRLIVRQAIHRLADLGLVRVRQGGATLVLDPNESASIEMFKFLYRFGALDRERIQDSIEHQYTNGLRLLDVAERRASDRALAEVRAVVDSFDADPSDDDAVGALEERFWRQVALAGGNHILKIELNWWYRTFADVSDQLRAAVSVSGATRISFFRQLAERLSARRGALDYYREAMAPLLERCAE